VLTSRVAGVYLYLIKEEHMSIYIKLVYTGSDITTELSEELLTLPSDEIVAILSEMIDQLKVDLLLIEQS
jgi:hypothetical protein